MFRLRPLYTLIWDSATTNRHLPGSSGPTRNIHRLCSTSKCISSLIPSATTPVLRTWCALSGLTRLGSHAYRVAGTRLAKLVFSSVRSQLLHCSLDTPSPDPNGPRCAEIASGVVGYCYRSSASGKLRLSDVGED